MSSASGDNAAGADQRIAPLDRPVADRVSSSSRQIGSDQELVQFSARLTARIRAAESKLDAPLYRDALAQQFCASDAVSSDFDHTHFLYRQMWTRYARVGGVDIEIFQREYQANRARLQERRARKPYVSARTRLVDDLVAEWVGDCLLRWPGQRPQVVLVGSGFDTRAYRLGCLAPCDVFEVDQEGVQIFKARRLDGVTDAAAARAQGRLVDVAAYAAATTVAGAATERAATSLSCDPEAGEAGTAKGNEAALGQAVPQCARRLVRLVGDVGSRENSNSLKLRVRQHEGVLDAASVVGSGDGSGTASGRGREAAGKTVQDGEGMVRVKCLTVSVGTDRLSYYQVPRAFCTDEAERDATWPGAYSRAPDAIPPSPALQRRGGWVISLLDGGLCPDRPTLWLAEGLLMYLVEAQAEDALTAMRDLCAGHPGSAVFADVFSTDTKASGLSYYSLFRSGVDRQEVFPFLRRCGFEAAKVARFGAPVPEEAGCRRDGDIGDGDVALGAAELAFIRAGYASTSSKTPTSGLSQASDGKEDGSELGVLAVGYGRFEATSSDLVAGSTAVVASPVAGGVASAAAPASECSIAAEWDADPEEVGFVVHSPLCVAWRPEAAKLVSRGLYSYAFERVLEGLRAAAAASGAAPVEASAPTPLCSCRKPFPRVGRVECLVFLAKPKQ